MKPDTVQKVEGQEIPITLDNKQITVFDYANKRAGELSSKLSVNKDALKNLKLAPEASQKVSAISGKMDSVSTQALDQIKRLQTMRSQVDVGSQSSSLETLAVKMDDGNMAPIEDKKMPIDDLATSLNTAEKILASKDTENGAKVMDQAMTENKAEPTTEQTPIQKKDPDLGNMNFNQAVNFVDNNRFQNLKDDKIIEQLVSAEKIDYIDEYDNGDDLEMTQLTDVYNAGIAVGEKVNGTLLSEIKVGEKMYLNNDDGGQAFEVNEIYNLEDKYVVETDDGFYSIQKKIQPTFSSSAFETNFVASQSAKLEVSTPVIGGAGNAPQDIRKIQNEFANTNKEDSTLPESAKDVVAEFLQSEKSQEPKTPETANSNKSQNLEIPVSEKIPTPDIPPVPRSEQRTINKEKPLTWLEAQAEADKRYFQAGKVITEKKNNFLSKTRKVGKWLSQIPGATAKLGIAGAVYGMGKLNQVEQFISTKYNNAVESAGKSIDKASLKIDIFKQDHKSRVNESRLEKARSKQEKIQSKLDKVNEKINSREQKATQNAENLVGLNKRLQKLSAPKNNSLENKKTNV